MSHAPVGSRTSSYSRSYSSGYRGSPISGEHAPVGNRSSGSYIGHVCDLTGDHSGISERATYCPSTGVATVYQTYAIQHAPVGTGEVSSLNGRVCSRPGGDVSSQFISAPASFEHADQTREEGGAQKFEGAKQIYESVVDAVTNPEPAGSGGIFAGLASYFSGSQKQYDANAEMMQAARDQVSTNRGGSPDAMNMESHGGGCVIA